MKRQDALALLRQHVSNDNLVKHMLATEAIMAVLALRFGEDAPTWALTGLLHDLDYDQTKDAPLEHSLRASEMLGDLGLDESIVHAVKAHNEVHGEPLVSALDKALFAVDPLTGLITAAALVRPDKRLAGVTTDSVLKRFGEKSFARGASRDQIRTCAAIGLSVEEFVALGLEAMQGIASDLGL